MPCYGSQHTIVARRSFEVLFHGSIISTCVHTHRCTTCEPSQFGGRRRMHPSPPRFFPHTRLPVGSCSKHGPKHENEHGRIDPPPRASPPPPPPPNVRVGWDMAWVGTPLPGEPVQWEGGRGGTQGSTRSNPIPSPRSIGGPIGENPWGETIPSRPASRRGFFMDRGPFPLIDRKDSRYSKDSGPRGIPSGMERDVDRVDRGDRRGDGPRLRRR